MNRGNDLYSWLNEDGLKPELLVKSLEVLLETSKQQIEGLINTDESLEKTIEELEKIDDKISSLWAYPSHMTAVMNTDDWQKVYNESIQLLSAYGSFLSSCKPLYTKLANLQKINNDKDTEYQRVLDLNVQDFELGGIHLNNKDQKQLSEWKQQLSSLSSQFSENVMKSTQSWSYSTQNEEELEGIPARNLEQFKMAAVQANKTGWLIGLDAPSYMAVMQYAESRSLREKIYRSYTSRASEFNPAYDNGPVMVEILNLRHLKAKKLGFASYAELSLAKKMARSTQEVDGLLNNLVDKTMNQAKAEFKQLKAFAMDRGEYSDLMPWDIAFWSEKLRRQTHQFDSESLRPYFPLTKVLEGMCTIIQRLYCIQFRKNNEAKTWVDGVECWSLYEEDALIGQVYLDLYARKGKRDGAWMNGCRDRSNLSGAFQHPIAFVVANFMPPGDEGVALLNHQEVVTLFHEMGHALHHLLTKVNTPSIAGTNQVAWDAVELPSQFFEHWAWQDEGLSLISEHIESGEPLPSEMKKRMIGAKNFQSAMGMVRQLEFSLFDFQLHQQSSFSVENIQSLLNDVRKHTSVVPCILENRFQNCFSHIFAGGYAAGYYSYKWAEVLSSDAFDVFEENGVFSQDDALRFKKWILEQGGRHDAAYLYEKFRGKSASIEPLLRHNGIYAD